MAELIQRVQTGLRGVAVRVAPTWRDERGQTSSEYLLIAGMAVVIILAVLGLFSGQLQTAASTIMGKITGAI